MSYMISSKNEIRLIWLENGCLHNNANIYCNRLKSYIDICVMMWKEQIESSLKKYCLMHKWCNELLIQWLCAINYYC